MTEVNTARRTRFRSLSVALIRMPSEISAATLIASSLLKSESPAILVSPVGQQILVPASRFNKFI
jgi:hypothetical protein